MVQVASGVPRYEPSGALIEEPSVNLLKYSEDFNNAIWTLINGGTGIAPIKTPNYEAAPDGTMTACRVQANRGAGNSAADYSMMRQWAGFPGTRSVWIKSNTGVNQNITIGGAGSITVTPQWAEYSHYNLTSGYFDLGSQGTIATTNNVDISVWHPQMEPKKYKTSYIATGSAVVYRAPRYEAGVAIMVEESSTNRLLHSNDFAQAVWTKTDLTLSSGCLDPVGTTGATRVIAGTAGTASLQQAVSINADTVNSFSIHLKAENATWFLLQLMNGANYCRMWVNLVTGVVGTILNNGSAAGAAVKLTKMGDYYRCTISGNLNGGFTTANIGVFAMTADNVTTRFNSATYYICGAQLEQKAQSTSYIPTAGIAVSRNPESLTMPTTNLMNGLAGTIVGRFYLQKVGLAAVVFATYPSNPSVNTIFQVSYSVSGFLSLMYGTGSSNRSSAPLACAEGWYEIGATWDSATSTVALYVNRIKVFEESIGFAIAFGTVLGIGTYTGSTNQLNSLVDGFATFGRALTEEEMAGGVF